MKAEIAPAPHKVGDVSARLEPGYAAWKAGKIKRGLEEAKDRKKMVPAEAVWKSLGLED